MMTQIKTAAEVKSMRVGGKLLARTLSKLRQEIKPGMTTRDLDEIALNMIIEGGGKPSFLGYQGFPASLCVSINEEIVHGIPGDRVIENGDIVGLDLGVTYDGLVTDSAITVAIGDIGQDAERLLGATERALYSAIDIVKAGVRTGDIGAVVTKIIDEAGFCVVESLCGHGVGHYVHEEPSITNFGNNGTGSVLKAGMTVAIEPCISISSNDMKVASDGWTCISADNSLSAQFEHTVLVTESGAEILTV